MELKLHANARTTPNTRATIQKSGKSVAELADELGVSSQTCCYSSGDRLIARRFGVCERSKTLSRCFSVG